MAKPNANLKRPGGALASRPLMFFWIVDKSGSMGGEKISTLNHAASSVVPEMITEAAENPNAQVMMNVLSFASGAEWVAQDVPLEEFKWSDLTAGGITDMGQAFKLMSERMSAPDMPERGLPPVLVLMSDGEPTDDYKRQLVELLQLPWGVKAVKIAISIGKDANDAVLEQFTGNKELVLQANNATELVKMIKWASTVPAAVITPNVPEQNAVPQEKETDSDRNGNGSDAGQETHAVPAAPPLPDPTPASTEDVW